jgi:hypothetical protein
MVRSGKLFFAACAGLSLCGAPVALAAQQRNFVQLKFYCASAAKPDAGYKIISVEAKNCTAARHTIQDAMAMELADPCHAQDPIRGPRIPRKFRLTAAPGDNTLHDSGAGLPFRTKIPL